MRLYGLYYCLSANPVFCSSFATIASAFLDVYRDNEYLNTASPQSFYSKRLNKTAAAAQSRQQTSASDDRTDRSSYVFLTEGIDDEPVIIDIIHKFRLNKSEQHVFRINADHTSGRSKIGLQLRLRVFGEGGMGNSRLIAAIHA
jgi:hypothetical protein